jgi:fructosamine-3-kinase
MDLPRLFDDLARATGLSFSGSRTSSVSGGSINHTVKAQTDRGPLFVKLNAYSQLDMFEAEAAGLAALEGADAVRVPAVIAVGAVADAAYLVLEWIDFGAKTPVAEAKLGFALAIQHRATRTEFGWDRDNTIGSTPQINEPTGNWQTFFRERRLRYQLDLADRNGLPPDTAADVERLLDKSEFLFDGYEPEASLLHGDLWVGNWAATLDGTPVIFDPAVYYGDREADLAMTRLFGGFGSAFYDAYDQAWPLAPCWERRVEFYNLYHLLNHFNLFGAGYLASVQDAVDKLLRDLP